jgi:hypothetical protein
MSDDGPQNWVSWPAKKLVNYYLERKQRALKGAHPSLVKDPKFCAGMLLRTFGGAAWDKEKELGVFPKKTRKLLRDALNAELREVHDVIQCYYCHRDANTGENLMQWLATPVSRRWACPACILKHKIVRGVEPEVAN